MSNKIFVNNIQEGENITTGICVLNDTIIKNFKNVYGSKFDAVSKLFLNSTNEGVYMLSRHFQYVVLLENNPEFGLMMRFTSFDNTDSALDEYLKLKNKGWAKTDIDKIMALYSEIQYESESADLIIDSSFNL